MQERKSEQEQGSVKLSGTVDHQTDTLMRSQQPVDHHTGRQTDRQTDTQTHRQTDRQTDRHTDTQTDRQTDRQTRSSDLHSEGSHSPKMRE